MTKGGCKKKNILFLINKFSFDENRMQPQENIGVIAESEDYNAIVKEMMRNLSKFGLTPNQAKVFIFLGKKGSKTASDIAKGLVLPRTETYQILKGLQHKGIVTATIKKPSNFKALPFNKTITILVNNEKERISDLETKKDMLNEIWKSIPSSDVSNGADDRNNKFQILQGKSCIVNKLKNMIENAKEEIQVSGSEQDYIKFYHTDVFNYLKKSRADMKILFSCSEKTMYIFDGFPPDSIRKFWDYEGEKFCFIIKDENEGILFMKNDVEQKEDNDENISAVWTDSKILITSLKTLFDLIWFKSNPLLPFKNGYGRELEYYHDLREAEQQKTILDFVHKHILKPKNRINFQS